MKLIYILIFLLINGCTTLNQVQLPPNQLHEKITDNELIHIGDNIEIVTSDGLRHKFKVTEIKENHILGQGVDIPISNIITLEKKEISNGKTLALTGALILIFQLLHAVAASATVGL